MRYRPRLDANQPAIVKELRECGISVVSLASVGSGCADLLCGFRGRNVLLEIKDPDKPLSARKLTTAEEKFHREWRGQISVVETTADALAVILGGETLHGAEYESVRP